MRKTFMKIFDKYCTPDMQNRLQQHPEYNEKLKDDPIWTLEVLEIRKFYIQRN